jgi:hypothetical protein
MKMAPKRRINGWDHTNTSVTGRTTRKMASGYNITPMATSMKADGSRINDMGRALFGWPMPKIS